MLPLPRAIARAGAATRSAAARLVAEGRVRVNGRPARDPALRVDPFRDRVEVDGSPLGPPPAPGEAPVLALNKPRGVLVTRSDPEGRPTVYDLLPRDRGLLRCVGRLDRASAGLLLATTDTLLAAALEDPRRGVLRLYRVKLRPRLREEDGARLAAGVALEGRPARPARVEVESHGPRSSWVRVGLLEGRNREIRRTCETLGYEVEHLVRLAYGPVALGDLAPGAHRLLSPAEAAALRRAAGAGAPPRAGIRANRRRGGASNTDRGG